MNPTAHSLGSRSSLSGVVAVLAAGAALLFTLDLASAAAKKPPPKKKKPTPAEAKKAADEAEALKELDTGGALFGAGKYAEALPHFERARDLDPTRSGPYRALGVTYRHLDRLVEARDAFEAYVKAKGSGPTVDEALSEIRSIEAELRKRELAARPEAPPKPVDDLPPPTGDGVTAPPPSSRESGGGFGPLRIVGLGGMALGAGALGTGIYFTIRWLGARSSFTAEYDPVRKGLTVEPGVEGTLYVCNDADFESFTPSSQAMLEGARAYCGPLSRNRILGPVLGAGGVILLAAGVALVIAGGGSSGGSSSGEDPTALKVPGLGAVRLDLAPLPGGLLLSAGARF